MGECGLPAGLSCRWSTPSKPSQAALPASTYIESVIVDRKELAAIGRPQTLPRTLANCKLITLRPRSLIPQRVKFRYRLDNYDHDWHDADYSQAGVLYGFASWEVFFRVIASNSDGIWNDNAAKLDFSVAPAYYQTNWFRALCAAAVLALVWAAVSVSVRQLAIMSLTCVWKQRVGERTRIARDLHDTLLQSFHGVMLHFQTGINLLSANPAEPRTAEARKALEKAMHQAKHAIVEGREAIQGLRSSVVETNDLALAMRTLGEELAANANSTAFQVHVEGTPRDLHPILRDEVYRITGESIRNAFRHADAKQIEVEIHYDDRRLRVRVRDDGKGIDPKLLSDGEPEGHFGLRGMRERAKLIGGKLTVWSELDAGTEVELSIPAYACVYGTYRRIANIG